MYTKIIDRQKLGEAWKRVRRNKPAAGVDEISCEEFEAGLKENLAQLYTELAEHRYESLPVKLVPLYKGEKRRMVSLYSMRDKVVQQSIASELIRLYDNTLSGSVYAYRPGRAALQAVNFLEEQLQREENAWMLKADIQNFFDTIPLGNLYGILGQTIREQDVIELIRACLEAPRLKKDGSMEPKRIGLYQGSGIAPVLSNIYLQEFDREMEQLSRVYVRYSDDILILGERRETLAHVRDTLRIKLERRGLMLNEEKTQLRSSQEGVDFLGYRLTAEGKCIPAKAEENLQSRLETIWMGHAEIEDKLKKGAEVLNGWEQYYRKEREIGSIEEFAVVLFMVRNKKKEIFESVRVQRIRFQNIYPDLCRWLAEVWEDPADQLFEYEQLYEIRGLDRDKTLSAESFCEIYRRILAAPTQEDWSDLMQMYADAGAYNKAAKAAQQRERLAQSKAGKFAAAVRPQIQAEAAVYNRTIGWEEGSVIPAAGELSEGRGLQETQEETAAQNKAAGQEGNFAISVTGEFPQGTGSKIQTEEGRNFAQDGISCFPADADFQQPADLGTYIGKGRATDEKAYSPQLKEEFSSSTVEHEEQGIGENPWAAGRETLFARAAASLAFLQAFSQTFAGREDIYGREECSGRKKRCVEQMDEPLTEETLQAHLRGSTTISTYVQRTNQTVKYMVIDVDISKKNLLQDGTEGALAKCLPLAAQTAAEIQRILKRLGLRGYLEYSGFRGYHIWVFFTEWIPTRYVNMLTETIEAQLEETPTDVTVEFFPNRSRLRNGFPGQCIKLPYGIHIRTGRRSMLLTDEFQEIFPDKEYLLDAAKFSLSAVRRVVAANAQKPENLSEKEVDSDLSGFGELPDGIRVVLASCSLMRYLCQKARTTGYLTHFERLSVLYVFGHLGDSGKSFVHTVMEFTLNYKYQVTEKFIQKIPAKPVSCTKLRDQYKQITAEYGCSCSFRRTKNCYPSPVLHAIESGEDLDENVTVPTSRTMSRAKEKQVVEELNIHKKVQDLAGRIVEMKKQKRGIDKAIRKIEIELEQIYDQAGTDCMEVDMGLLVRRRKEEGYEWLIEI